MPSIANTSKIADARDDELGFPLVPVLAASSLLANSGVRASGTMLTLLTDSKSAKEDIAVRVAGGTACRRYGRRIVCSLRRRRFTWLVAVTLAGNNEPTGVSASIGKEDFRISELVANKAQPIRMVVIESTSFCLF